MNCAECRDNLVACGEGLLARDETLQCRAHLETCAACRAEYEAIASLQQRLIARGQAAAGVGIAEPVMRRIRREQFQPERETMVSKLFKYRWGFGLGTAAAAAAIILLILLVSPRTQATAAEVLAKGARAVAKLTSIHLRGQMRTYPGENFGAINPDHPFCTIELWKQFEPELKWRVEKPGRVAVMDGQSKVMFIKTANEAFKHSPGSTWDFDTEWLQKMANLSTTISNELDNARSQGWKLDLAEKTGADGRAKSIVTVHAEFGLPEDDPMKNLFFDIADARRVYCFDARTKLLEAVQIFLRRPSGEVLIFDLSQIDYNQPVKPALWQLELPANVNWIQEAQILPDNGKYASMTAEQATRAFLEACGREDWNEVGKFISSITAQLKQYSGGLEVISVGKSYGSKVYAGRFVPYTIKLPPEEINMRLSNENPAKRYVLMGIYDSKLQPTGDDDLKWTNTPAILPDNDVYARMSPVEVVKACFGALTNMDWPELKKFSPDDYVEKIKRQLEEEQKAGMDMHKLMPGVEIGEAFWSPEQSAWFVKCQVSQIRGGSMAVRKDNPAGRWQVDGGF